MRSDLVWKGGTLGRLAPSMDRLVQINREQRGDVQIKYNELVVCQQRQVYKGHG